MPVPSLGRRSILLIGDSLTQRGWGGGKIGGSSAAGWASLVAAAYSRKADVFNRGFGGYTSRGGLALIDRLLPAPDSGERLLLTTIFFGANDSAEGSAQSVPLAEYEANLTAIVTAAARVSDTVLVISPPPVDEARWPDRSNSRLADYASAAERAAAEARVSCTGCTVGYLDLRPLFLSHVDWVTALMNDGLHLSPAGEALVGEFVLTTFYDLAPKSAPDELPWDAPFWRELPGSIEGVAKTLSESGIAAMRSRPPVPMPNIVSPPQPNKNLGC